MALRSAPITLLLILFFLSFDFFFPSKSFFILQQFQFRSNRRTRCEKYLKETHGESEILRKCAQQQRFQTCSRQFDEVVELFFGKSSIANRSTSGKSLVSCDKNKSGVALEKRKTGNRPRKRVQANLAGSLEHFSFYSGKKEIIDNYFFSDISEEIINLCK